MHRGTWARLGPIGSQRVRHNCSDLACMHPTVYLNNHPCTTGVRFRTSAGSSNTYRWIRKRPSTGHMQPCRWMNHSQWNGQTSPFSHPFFWASLYRELLSSQAWTILTWSVPVFWNSHLEFYIWKKKRILYLDPLKTGSEEWSYSLRLEQNSKCQST